MNTRARQEARALGQQVAQARVQNASNAAAVAEQVEASVPVDLANRLDRIDQQLRDIREP